MNRNDPPRLLAEGKYLRMLAGQGWEWVDRVNASGAVVIAAVTERREIVLVEQYRIPLSARVIDLPAGLVGDDPGTRGEPLLAAARRELLEETGYEAPQLEPVISGPSGAGLTTEQYTLFVARAVRQVGPGGGEGNERIDVHVVPIDGIDAWLDRQRRDGVLVDPKIYVGLYFVR